MKHRITILTAATALTLVAVEPALAASSAHDVGRNLGNLLKEWAGWLFGGVTALVAIPYVARRDVAGGLTFMLLAVLVGGFVLAGPTIADLIEGIYQTASTGR